MSRPADVPLPPTSVSAEEAGLRDYLAAACLTAAFAPFGRFSNTADHAQAAHREHLARECYWMADAMLAARVQAPPARAGVDLTGLDDAE